MSRKDGTILIKAIAKDSFMLCYGTTDKAWVTVNKNSKWRVMAGPGKGCPWYSIRRGNVTLNVMQGIFSEHFEVING